MTVLANQLEQGRPLGTFREFGYFLTCFHEKSISCYSGKIDKAVLVFQTACVILDEATMPNVLPVAGEQVVRL